MLKCLIIDWQMQRSLPPSTHICTSILQLILSKPHLPLPAWGLSSTELFLTAKNWLLPLFRPSSLICFKGEGPNSSSTGRKILLTRTLLLEYTKQGPCHSKTVPTSEEETTATVMTHFVLWHKHPLDTKVAPKQKLQGFSFWCLSELSRALKLLRLTGWDSWQENMFQRYTLIWKHLTV